MPARLPSVATVTCRLHALCLDAREPDRLAEFWGSLLGWRPADDERGALALEPADDTGFRLRFVASAEPKTLQNLMHFDLTSTSLDDQATTVARVLELGGRHCDVGQGPDDDHVVLADPEGNEMCVIEPWNNFLADCGFIGAVSSDGSAQVGHFWSEALGWPLVWDQDGETAVQSPRGGTKVSWGGPPVAVKRTRNRQRFDLVATEPDTDLARLVDLGASRLADVDGGVELADPDGNEFLVTPG